MISGGLARQATTSVTPCGKNKINGELHSKLVGGWLHAQEGELASCFGRSVVHTAILHFMSLVTNEQEILSLLSL